MAAEERRQPKWWVFYVPGDDKYWGSGKYIKECTKGRCYWTCSRHTRTGDSALLYAKSPISALVAVMSVVSDAEVDLEERQFSSTDPSWCYVDFQAVLKKPIALRAMREDLELRDAWGLVRSQFQSPGGRPPVIDDRIIGMLGGRIPELRKYLRG